MLPFDSKDAADIHRYRRLLGFYILCVAGVSAVYGFISARKGSGWGVGEWLTNYSAGFIRRGLIGELILLASRATHIGPVWVALTVQIAVFLVFLWCVYALLKNVEWSFALAALLFSPATLSFMVLDPPAIFKKEILLFAALGVMVLTLLHGRLKDWQITALLTAFGASLVLSHEPIFFYLPYFFAALAIQRESIGGAIRIVALPALVCLGVVVAVGRHPGDLQMAKTICASVGGTFGEPNQGVCGGSMMALGQSLADARTSTRQLIAVLPEYFFGLYTPLLLLAVAPVAWMLREMWKRAAEARVARIVVACGAVSFAGSLFLFAVALDWGRWIHMHVVCLMLVLLMAKQRSGAEIPAIKSPVRTGASRQRIAVAALLLYATCWTLPSVYIYPPRFGYPALCRWLVAYRNHGVTVGIGRSAG